jgi:hypothetical protein
MALGGFTVTGTCLVTTGTGSSGASETCGYTESGVDVDYQEFKEPIHTDVSGPNVPHDHQDMGMVATITIPFANVDRTVFQKLFNRGDRTTLGKANTPGLVLGGGAAIGAAGNYYFKLGLAAPFDTPWTFFACTLKPGMRFRMATKFNPWVVTLFAFPYALATATAFKDTDFFNRSSF